jgi:hypothetical protein
MHGRSTKQKRAALRRRALASGPWWKYTYVVATIPAATFTTMSRRCGKTEVLKALESAYRRLESERDEPTVVGDDDVV